MKAFILVDENNIVRCMASEKCNLHKNKLHMDRYLTEVGGVVGDEYDSETDSWVSRPENYPQPTDKQKQRMLIGERKNKIIEDQAVRELIAEGSLPPDYKPEDNNA